MIRGSEFVGLFSGVSVGRFLFFPLLSVRSCSRMSWQNMQVPLQICVSADSDAPSKISVVPLSRGLKIENLASDSDGSTMFSKDALLHAGRRLLKNNNVRAQDA